MTNSIQQPHLLLVAQAGPSGVQMLGPAKNAGVQLRQGATVARVRDARQAPEGNFNLFFFVSPITRHAPPRTPSTYPCRLRDQPARCAPPCAPPPFVSLATRPNTPDTPARPRSFALCLLLSRLRLLKTPRDCPPECPRRSAPIRDAPTENGSWLRSRQQASHHGAEQRPEIRSRSPDTDLRRSRRRRQQRLARPPHPPPPRRRRPPIRRILRGPPAT